MSIAAPFLWHFILFADYYVRSKREMENSSPITVDKKPPQPDHVAALISHEQARESLMRFVNSVRGRTPGAIISEPFQESDDDAILNGYIAQQEHRESLRR